jgi:hypothetical protein
MAIRYEVEVERTVSVTALSGPNNSRRAIDWRGVGREFRFAVLVLFCIMLGVWLVVAVPNLIDGLTDTATVHHYLNEPSPTEDYGKAPEDEPKPPVISKTKKAKPPARRKATAQERDYAEYCAMVLREPQYNWGMVPGCREQFPDLERRALRTIEAEARKVYDAGRSLPDDCKAVEGTGAPCRAFTYGQRR